LALLRSISDYIFIWLTSKPSKPAKMGSGFPDDVKDKLASQIHLDPQIPRNEPTVPTWQMPPHSLANVQSENLSPVTDMAIIGSGVTGCSAVSSLLESPLLGNRTVTVYEARSLTSGATSRNAGFLLSHIPKYFKDMVEGYGREEAIRIARLCNRTLEKMSELAASEANCELRSVYAILAYPEEEALQACLESIQLYEETFPEQKGLYSTITRETAEKVNGGLIHL
jgi:hypothetical protein